MDRSDDLRLRAIKDALGALGYPGFLSLFSEIEAEEGHDPAVVLMAALACDRLDEPVVEALPWLVLRYGHLDWNWLVSEARRRGVQNRLGFVVSLALRVAAGSLAMDRLARLAAVEEELFACRLTKQETRWLRAAPASRMPLGARRSEEAVQWGVPSALRADEIRFLAEL